MCLDASSRKVTRYFSSASPFFGFTLRIACPDCFTAGCESFDMETDVSGGPHHE